MGKVPGRKPPESDTGPNGGREVAGNASRRTRSPQKEAEALDIMRPMEGMVSSGPMTEPTVKRDARVYVNRELLDAVKEKFPETKGLKYSGLVDFALRKTLKDEVK